MAPGYSPAQFGTRWADTDRNGCDQRNDVLQRDLTGVQLKPGSRCVVVAGVLQDPYTGKRIVFAKAEAAKVQIDHVVARSAAWQTGAATWTAAKRLQFATDERLELLAVDGPTNAAKGDADAASWLPLNTGFHCPRGAAAWRGRRRARWRRRPGWRTRRASRPHRRVRGRADCGEGGVRAVGDPV